jgi:hypothetical protein
VLPETLLHALLTARLLPADSGDDEALSDEEGEDLNPPRRNIKIENVTVSSR